MFHTSTYYYGFGTKENWLIRVKLDSHGVQYLVSLLHLSVLRKSQLTAIRDVIRQPKSEREFILPHWDDLVESEHISFYLE